MTEVELYSWFFVSKEWAKLKRMPYPDQGFEDSFREYMYNNIKFDVVSMKRDMGLGLSYLSLSETPHELDVVCSKGNELFVFELKHYEVSDVTKEIVFTFLGKVMDFYLRNADVLSNYKINLFLVTVNNSIDDSIRKMCITYGIKLIEPMLMTIGTLDYFVQDLYQKIPAQFEVLMQKAGQLVEGVGKAREEFDYTFSDILTYENEAVKLDLALLKKARPSEILREVKKCYGAFQEVWQEWKLQVQKS